MGKDRKMWIVQKTKKNRRWVRFYRKPPKKQTQKKQTHSSKLRGGVKFITFNIAGPDDHHNVHKIKFPADELVSKRIGKGNSIVSGGHKLYDPSKNANMTWQGLKDSLYDPDEHLHIVKE